MIDKSQSGGIVTLTINRPERRNAFDAATTTALAEAVEALAGDADARLVVIKGAGGHFSAGKDLKEVETGDEARSELLRRHEDWVRVFHALHRLPVPSLAVVEGYAVAGGFTLAMGCDFVIAERGARFGALEMRNGFPASVCTPILARLLGPRLGLELALFGEAVGAERLYEMGLINRLADGSEELQRTAQAFADHIAGLDADAVKLTRETFRAAENMPIDNALDMGKHLNQLLAASGWFAEGAAVGLKKKPT
jgi:enoyl-CoA hydratase/carnithine racemase